MPPMFWVVVCGLFGAILGSYVNMAAYRLPRGISTVTRTRSFCPSCKHQLMWYDNLPLLSYLLLLGKCRYCSTPIPRRYFITEVLVSTLFGLAALQFVVLNGVPGAPPWVSAMPTALFVVQLFLIVDLVLLSVVDLEAWLIPVETTLPWAAAGLALAPIFPELHLAATVWTGNARLDALIDSFSGLVIGAGLLWSIGFLTTAGSYFYFKHKGRDDRPLEGMGLGDVHLMAMVGALLGWKAALATMFIGFFFGAVSGVAKMWWEEYRRRTLGDAYKPWQPTFDVEQQPDPSAPPPPPPQFWDLGLMGLFVLAVSALLLYLSSSTFKGTIVLTREEQLTGVLMLGGTTWVADLRCFPAYLMMIFGALLVLASIFLRHLAALDKLPGGDIQQTAEGEAKEVMQGNYVPFGPSLAAAGIVVALYDPLIRTAAFWWITTAGAAPFPPLPWRVLGW